MTNRDLSKTRETVEFYLGELEKLVTDRLKPKYNEIWMVGGAETTKDFIRQGLADEIVISILPIILGDGILFFDYIGQEQELHLTVVNAFKNGMVELSYQFSI